MVITLWILNVLLALMFLMAGGMKLAKSKDTLVEEGMTWAVNTSPAVVKLIGIAEVLGAVGLILPMALKTAVILTPIAAVGLGIIALSAAILHMTRKEPFIVPLILFFVNVASAIIGFMMFA